MNIKTRKIISGMTALMLAASLALTGCGSESADTTGEQTTVASASDETAAEAAAESEAQENASAEGSDRNKKSEEDLKNMNAAEVSVLMGNGINLGNTLEAYGHSNYALNTETDPTSFETLWGQPVTTAEMIQGMKDAGFDAIRIPIAWTNGMNYESGDYTIDERLMNRVDQIVNWALDADMYVIINDHWDGSWWGKFGSATPETVDEAWAMYKEMWTQIGEHFKDYSYKLIFESANEELGDRLNDKDVAPDSGTLKTADCYSMTTQINQAFVDTIRAQGGNNADRFLLIAGYNTDIERTCNERYVMPTDTADGKLFLSVHYYTPWDYCGTTAVTQWGSPKNYEQQNELLEMLTKFTDQGYGIIIGEYAVMNNGGAPKPDIDKWTNNFLNNCDLYNYVPMLWDCSEYYKRLSGKIESEMLAEIYSSRSYAAQSSLSQDEVKANAKAGIENDLKSATETMMDGISLPASDDMAIAWIMYNSSDYGVAYSVGDTYDPTNATYGVVAENCEITGEGTYTVSLDFTDIGGARGFGFSALGISNGEKFFPDYIATIDKIEINGEERPLTATPYTSSDDGKCTRVNIYNQWVSSVPDDARTVSEADDLGAVVLDVKDKEKVNSISVTFTVTAP